MRIGLFGGTFDPVHLGHLTAARIACREAALERIILIPAALPPHKPGRSIADASARLEMLRLAIDADPALEVSEIELKRSGPSYTIDTLRVLEAALPDDVRLALIVGLDAFLEMDTWRATREIFQESEVVVIPRSGLSPTADMASGVIDFLHRHIDGGYRYDASQQAFVHAIHPAVRLCRSTPPAIAATDIRRRVQLDLDIDHLVPACVSDYIHQKGLYR